MSAETTGFGHVLLGRPQRMNRHGILTFLRTLAEDRGTMLELRRLLAEELSRSAIFRMRDEVVLEQLADRYVRGSLSLVFVRPRDTELEGFMVTAEAPTVIKDQKNKAGDLKPAPEIPPEYPVLARKESDQIVASTLNLVAKLGALMFSTFGRDKRRTTLGRELILMAADQSGMTNKMRNAMDVVLALQLHPQGEVPRKDPQVKDAYVAAAAEIAAGPKPAAKAIVDLIVPLARVNTQRRFSNPVTDMATKNEQTAGEDNWLEIELVDDGDPPKPIGNTRYRVEMRGRKVFEGMLDAQGKARVEGVPKGSGTVSFPDIDESLGGGGNNRGPGAASANKANEKETLWFDIELLDDAGNPVPNARYRVEAADGKIILGTLDSEGKARVDGIAKGEAKVTFPDIDGDSWSAG